MCLCAELHWFTLRDTGPRSNNLFILPHTRRTRCMHSLHFEFVLNYCRLHGLRVAIKPHTRIVLHIHISAPVCTHQRCPMPSHHAHRGTTPCNPPSILRTMQLPPLCPLNHKVTPTHTHTDIHSHDPCCPFTSQHPFAHTNGALCRPITRTVAQLHATHPRFYAPCNCHHYAHSTTK